MKKPISILLLILLTISVFGQDSRRKRSTPWYKIEDITNTRHFIWHGDTIDFTWLNDSLIVLKEDSLILFVTPKQLSDSLALLPGGHAPITIDSVGNAGGMYLDDQEIGQTQASNSTNGWLWWSDWLYFYNKLSFVSHNSTLSGNGTDNSPLSVDSTNIPTLYWINNQGFLTSTDLDYNNLTNKPTIPTISNIAYGPSWDNNLDGVSANAIYDALASLGGHDEVTLATSAQTGGLALFGQELSFLQANGSQNGYLTSTDWNTFNNKVSFPGFTSLFADYGFTDNSTNWNTAYGWGDHSLGGYLTSFTETDPVFTAWDKDYNDLINTPSAFTPTTIDTDYGIESVSSAWTFNTNSSGIFGTYDLTIGNSADYGAIRIGNAGIYRSNQSFAGIDLGGAFVLRNEANLDLGNDPGIEFALMEGGNNIRFAIPESGAGNSTAMIRSVTIAGPYAATNDIVLGDYWTTNNSNLDFDTGTTGADLFVQDDTEIEGTLFLHENINLNASGANQYSLSVGTPTAARTATFPDKTGTVAFTDDLFTNGDETDPVFSAWDKDYNDLINKPSLGSGGSTSDLDTIVQASHNLIVQNAIYLDKTDSLYKRAIANSVTTAKMSGIVKEVISVDTFVFQFSGRYEVGNWQPGVDYFLSRTVAGYLEPEPNYTGGDIRQFAGEGKGDWLQLNIDIGDEIPDNSEGKGRAYFGDVELTDTIFSFTYPSDFPSDKYPYTFRAYRIKQNGHRLDREQLPIWDLDLRESGFSLKTTPEATHLYYHVRDTSTVQNLIVDNYIPYGIQILSGTTPIMDVNDGMSAILDITGNTIITMENLIAGSFGVITVYSGPEYPAYTITFSGGYVFDIDQSVSLGGDVVRTSGLSGKDSYGWHYNGRDVTINGKLDYVRE